MNVLRKYIDVFVKSKPLMICIVITVLIFLVRVYYIWHLWNDITIIALETTNALSIYIFFVFLFITYEYVKRVRREKAIETQMGKDLLIDLFCKFLVLVIIAFIFTIILIVCNVILFGITIDQLGWKYIDHDYIVHIIQNLLINNFLLSILAIVIAIAISPIERRLIAYILFLIITFLCSPFIDKLLNILATKGITDVYAVREFINVMPINLDFSPNYMFGFSILPYRLFLIVFWISLFAFISLLRIFKTKLIKILMLIICAISLTVFCLPASKVIMDYSTTGSAVGDQWYYDFNKDLISKNEKANFKITNYNMDFKVGRLLTAKVDISVDQPLLQEYKMTLYHGYKVSKVVNQSNENLQFVQAGDYITINGNGKELKNITMTYQGYSAKFYSNYQGVCLPGYFPYYPRAGFCKLGESNNNGWFCSFLDEETSFNIRIKGPKKVHTNLKEKGENFFVGKCNGLTIMSGFLKEKNDKNIKVVYPYLDDYIENGKNQKERINSAIKSLREKGYTDCTLFIMPNLNQSRNGIISKNQILSTWIFEDLKELEEELYSFT